CFYLVSCATQTPKRRLGGEARQQPRIAPCLLYFCEFAQRSGFARRFGAARQPAYPTDQRTSLGGADAAMGGARGSLCCVGHGHCGAICANWGKPYCFRHLSGLAVPRYLAHSLAPWGAGPSPNVCMVVIYDHFALHGLAHLSERADPSF